MRGVLEDGFPAATFRRPRCASPHPNGKLITLVPLSFQQTPSRLATTLQAPPPPPQSPPPPPGSQPSQSSPPPPPPPPPGSSPTRLPLTIVTLLATPILGTLLYLYLTDTRASIHTTVTMPLMHLLMDPEEAHAFSIWCAKWGIVPRERGDIEEDGGRLATELFNYPLPSPLGLAAGYDKNAAAIDAFFALGFSTVEIGSVTPLPQPGNPQPRMFRLSQDKAVINRYGFNSEGVDVVEARLAARYRKHQRKYGLPDNEMASLPKSLIQGKMLGVNLGKNKTSKEGDNSDYVVGVERLGRWADYVVVNVSSPNTPGLRRLQGREMVGGLLGDVIKARNTLPHHPPLLIKIAPDLTDTQIHDIADMVAETGVDGVIISNTTIARPIDLKSPMNVTTETGGLSGPPLLPLSLRAVQTFSAYAQAKGYRIPIIACGGISTADDVMKYRDAGAVGVQMYTGLAYHGPGIVGEIKRGLREVLAERGETWAGRKLGVE
ncbi:uncharacterized protein EV422DRAFT_501048 [Fimicolochytrium jonesii]|uniref:uncharacterized protein n=1 Tax=Fimicolochytrium jonesii TaxID=1396493 RepID=UPI0022FEAAA9|nr:uncharacterized protein EV422DRAFT_501048 [Fimicolochytrium jonesii]KAI8816642.1 hypothetical protein EV422DRAFT_501048 [Fimicolochytrium jonesii]